jgi:hypothetical protein
MMVVMVMMVITMVEVISHSFEDCCPYRQAHKCCSSTTSSGWRGSLVCNNHMSGLCCLCRRGIVVLLRVVGMGISLRLIVSLLRVSLGIESMGISLRVGLLRPWRLNWSRRCLNCGDLSGGHWFAEDGGGVSIDVIY